MCFLIDGLYHLHTDTSVNINEQIVNEIGLRDLEIGSVKSIYGTLG